jgi:hypothetical protein
MNRCTLLSAMIAAVGCAGNGPDDTSMAAQNPAPVAADPGILSPGLSNTPLTEKIAPIPACKMRPPSVSRDSAPLGSDAPDPTQPGESLGFFPVQGVAPHPGFNNGDPIELKLAGPVSRTPVEPLSLTLTFVSHTDGKVVLVRPLDASLEQWRFPYYDLYARDESDGVVYRYASVGARCGNVNPIVETDYVEIESKQSRGDVVNEWGRHLANAVLPKPGRYTVWVVYSFCGWDGGGIPLGTNFIRPDVHLGVHASNPHTVIVQ